MHSTRSTNPNTDAEEYQGTLSWFLNPESQASSHFVVNGKGEVTPVVPLSLSAWHAGRHNPYSHGIEFTQPDIDRPYTEGHYQGGKLCYYLINEWQRSRGYPEIPPVRVMTALGASGLVGHQNTEQGIAAGKSDPGYQWQWPKFLSML